MTIYKERKRYLGEIRCTDVQHTWETHISWPVKSRYIEHTNRLQDNWQPFGPSGRSVADCKVMSSNLQYPAVQGVKSSLQPCTFCTRGVAAIQKTSGRISWALQYRTCQFPFQIYSEIQWAVRKLPRSQHISAGLLVKSWGFATYRMSMQILRPTQFLSMDSGDRCCFAKPIVFGVGRLGRDQCLGFLGILCCAPKWQPRHRNCKILNLPDSQSSKRSKKHGTVEYKTSVSYRFYGWLHESCYCLTSLVMVADLVDLFDAKVANAATRQRVQRNMNINEHSASRCWFILHTL